MFYPASLLDCLFSNETFLIFLFQPQAKLDQISFLICPADLFLRIPLIFISRQILKTRCEENQKYSTSVQQFWSHFKLI